MYMSHTILKAYGDKRVEGAVIAAVDSSWRVVPGSEKDIKVDTICLAVGLSPMSNLLRMAGCDMADLAAKGGLVPIVDDNGENLRRGHLCRRGCVRYRGGQLGDDQRAHRRRGGRL